MQLTHDNFEFENINKIYDWIDDQKEFWHDSNIGILNDLTKLQANISRSIQSRTTQQGLKLLNTHPNFKVFAHYPFTKANVETEFLKQLEKNEPHAAQLAYQRLKENYHSVKADTELTSLFNGTFKKRGPSYKAYQNTLKSLTSDHKDRVAAINAHLDEHTEKQLKKINSRIRHYRRWGRSAFNKSNEIYLGHHIKTNTDFKEMQSTTDEAVKKIEATDKAYKEFMKLKAPVEYWENKASKHEIKEEDIRKWMVLYFIITFIILAIVYFAGFSLLNTGNNMINPQVSLFLAGGALTVTTFAVWIGRLITRIYLSEKHLRMDAEERAIMTQTYLALSNDDTTTDNDRAIILASLFRPTEDGIVKDDAAPFMDIAKWTGK